MKSSLFVCQRNNFQLAKKIAWSDVVSKISNEFRNASHKIIFSTRTNLPTFVLHSDYRPGTLQNAFDEVKQRVNVKDMHVYISFAENSETFGRHADLDNVLIVQALGAVSYKFDDGSVKVLLPGDSLYIPKGVHHAPVTHNARVTLSFSL